MQRRRSDSSRKQNARLPAIAPKGEQSAQAGPSASSTGSVEYCDEQPMSRTCRQRKVKCDERRPSCGQCERLGHTCDYSARLSFRDDTARVVEKMQEVTKTGSGVWDPQTNPDEMESNSPVEDDLPPFAELTNDEDRERKAKSRIPGTFNVIVNPESFSDLDEYRVELRRSPSSMASPSAALAGQDPTESASASTMRTNDPAVIILRKFEDVTRRTSTRTSNPAAQDQVTSPMSPASPTRSPNDEEQLVERQSAVQISDDTVMPGISESRQQVFSDSRLKEHYRSFISPRIAYLRQQTGFSSPNASQEPNSEADLFEEQANNFPPLHHAIMALSAVSVAHRTGLGGFHALQFYQQALPSLQESLKGPADVVSDGALFTHFVLLLCEIAAADIWASNLWGHHLSQLYRIIVARQQMFGHEPHGFILWWICNIDAHAMLSGSGNADFISAMANDELLPLSDWITPIPRNPGADVSLQDRNSLIPVVDFNRKIMILAAGLGRLGRDLRALDTRRADQESPLTVHSDIAWREQLTRLLELRASLKRVWESEMPFALQDDWLDNIGRLPLDAGIFLRLACLLYHACIIFSYTSMWASQRVQTPAAAQGEIDYSGQEILKLAQRTIEHNTREYSFTVFPLFMAGFASSMVQDRMAALNMLRSLEGECIGGSTKAARQLLEEVYTRQDEGLAISGQITHVDWLQIMADKTLQVVFLGV